VFVRATHPSGDGCGGGVSRRTSPESLAGQQASQQVANNFLGQEPGTDAEILASVRALAGV
jgi:hypothetical protein